MPTDILTGLASHGVLGIFAAVALWSAWMKDKQLTECQEARLADSKASTEKLLGIAGQTFAAVDKLSEAADRIYETRKTP